MQRDTLPWWVSLLDAATIVYALFALSLICFGGVDISFFDTQVSARSLPRLLLIGGGSLVLRHVVCPRPSLPARFWQSVLRLVRSETVRAVWPAFAVTRLGVLIVGFLAVMLIGFIEARPPFRISSNEFTNLLARWDHHLLIRGHGLTA